MTRLLATLGTSPGVVYETLLNLCRGSYGGDMPRLAIDEVTLVYTSNRLVREAYAAARLLVLCRDTVFEEGDERRLPGNCRVERVTGAPLGFEDITGRREYEEYINTIRRLISPGDIVDVSGGRAAMAAGAALIAALEKPKAMIVATVVSSEAYQKASESFRKLLEQEKKPSILMDELAGRSCSLLAEEYEPIRRILASLVTGRATTYILYPV